MEMHIMYFYNSDKNLKNLNTEKNQKKRQKKKHKNNNAKLIDIGFGQFEEKQ